VDGQVVRSPAITSSPPPRSTYRFSTLPDPAGGNIVSLRTTTARLSNVPDAVREVDVTSTLNVGVVPIDSAFDRNKLSSARSLPLTTTTATASPGVRAKKKELSAGS
jgi:hypothetical protein